MSAEQPNNKITISQIDAFRASMLDWYDEHRRVLPWRAREGEQPVPYRVWLSEVMLQQTTVNAVIPYFNKFVDKWPGIHDLAAADQNEVMDEWAGLGYYSRARNLHKCANIIVGDYEGIFPHTQKELKALPGIGDYISAAVASIAFDTPAAVVDGNVERVLSRYYAVKDPLPHSKKHLKSLAGRLADGREDRPGDFAQAMMDLGATICTPKSPKCMLCPLRKSCQAFSEGLAADLPYKIKKGTQPQKYGFIYWVENMDGDVLLQRRPDTGMLARMIGFPTNDWQKTKKDAIHPQEIVPVRENLEKLPVKVSHSFTHFDIHLHGYKYVIDKKEQDILIKTGYYWEKRQNLAKTNFPTLFKKFYKSML